MANHLVAGIGDVDAAIGSNHQILGLAQLGLRGLAAGVNCAVEVPSPA